MLACIRIENKHIALKDGFVNSKGKIALASICGACFIGLIVLVRCVDVQPIGPEGTSIGLSHLNQYFFTLCGVNILWYDITDYLGIFAILIAGIFALIGLVQLIKRRSLFQVDHEILALGGLYIVVIGLYVLFEFAIVNYRPIIMPDALQPEASFPSSHTMLVCTIMGSTMMVIGEYIENTTLRRIIQVLCAVIIVVMVVGRLLCGVHWFSDILGGVLISATLLTLYSLALDRMHQPKHTPKHARTK